MDRLIQLFTDGVRIGDVDVTAPFRSHREVATAINGTGHFSHTTLRNAYDGFPEQTVRVHVSVRVGTEDATRISCGLPRLDHGGGVAGDRRDDCGRGG